MKRKFWTFVFACLLLVLAGFESASAQSSTPVPRPVTDDEVNAIAKQMFCPVCENTPLDVCPTQACAEWRALIRDKLSIGWTEQQIKDYFVQQYGARVLATPPATGLNWLVYIIPPVAFLVGAFVLFKAFQSWRSQAAGLPEESPAQPSGDEYMDRLEAELRKQK